MPKKRGLLINNTRKRLNPINNTNPNGVPSNISANTRKKSLEPLFSKSPQHLLKGYNNEELSELFDKVADLETEISNLLEKEPEIDQILGSKMDNETLWFYVRWANKECSFIPAKALGRIAPEKVIKYYESILNFTPSKKEENPFLSENDNKTPSSSTTTLGQTNRPRLLTQQCPTVTVPLQPPPTQSPSTQVTPPPPLSKKEKTDFSCGNCLKPQKIFRTMNCTGCLILLQYPEGTKAIKCPSCNTVMQAR